MLYDLGEITRLILSKPLNWLGAVVRSDARPPHFNTCYNVLSLAGQNVPFLCMLLFLA